MIADILLLRVTEDARVQLLNVCGSRLGLCDAHICAAMVPAEVVADKVSYSGGKNKAILPRNLRQRIADYFQESVLEICVKDSQNVQGPLCLAAQGNEKQIQTLPMLVISIPPLP